jgi:hypothetical protein
VRRRRVCGCAHPTRVQRGSLGSVPMQGALSLSPVLPSPGPAAQAMRTTHLELHAYRAQRTRASAGVMAPPAAPVPAAHAAGVNQPIGFR